jgi:hypothetical protein
MSPTTTFRSLLTILSACALLVLPACDDGAKEEVRAVFDAYHAARANNDAAAAMKLVDPENVKHYDYIVQVARSGTRDKIQRMKPYERLQVTRLRNRLTAEELRTLDGQGYMQIVFERGWEGSGDTGTVVTLGPITIKKPRATGVLIADGEPSGLKLEFVEVEHQWLLNDESLDRLYDGIIERTAARLNTTDDKLILTIESRKSGKSVDRAIWDEPPK